ncbi:MAG TPA: hypothetical protein VK908_09830 [Jiangellales bacterium]|nr:hypothetical protein [Jiangellales bacterium]
MVQGPVHGTALAHDGDHGGKYAVGGNYVGFLITAATPGVFEGVRICDISDPRLPQGAQPRRRQPA